MLSRLEEEGFRVEWIDGRGTRSEMEKADQPTMTGLNALCVRSNSSLGAPIHRARIDPLDDEGPCRLSDGDEGREEDAMERSRDWRDESIALGQEGHKQVASEVSMGLDVIFNSVAHLSALENSFFWPEEMERSIVVSVFEPAKESRRGRAREKDLGETGEERGPGRGLVAGDVREERVVVLAGDTDAGLGRRGDLQQGKGEVELAVAAVNNRVCPSFLPFPFISSSRD
jgi:hypothetical protein